MEISFTKITLESDFEDIKSLYLSAFPPAERREFSGLVQQLYNDECIVNLIFADQMVAGFIILWEFNDFIFIEHFAIEPHLRRLGIGKKAISGIKTLYQKTVILETELPHNELSQRRIGFYERNGFQKLNRTYFQPSYDGVKPEVKLMLMTTSIDFTEDELDLVLKKIRKKVYLVN